ncbi:MAG: hypothetical protein ACLRMZ_27730 [Blautia marasmi]
METDDRSLQGDRYFCRRFEDIESRVYIPYESGKKILALTGTTVQVRTVYIRSGEGQRLMR